MKHGQISPAPGMNARIYRCFEVIAEEDARKFVKKFAEQPHDGPQILHTVMELVLGAHMVNLGLPARYDVAVDGLTPDWCLRSPEVAGLVELINAHAPKAVEDDIKRQTQAKGTAAWWMPPNTDRLYWAIRDKAVTYKEIVERRGIPYVAAVFGRIEVDIDQDEIDACLSHPETGLFAEYPSMSGVVFIGMPVGYANFRYHPNPRATRPFKFPAGRFDLPSSP